MRRLVVLVLAAGLAVTPAQARDFREQIVDVRPGAFVGVRLSFSPDRNGAARPRAAFTIAPTQSRFSGDGMVRTRIGEGLALNLTPDARPSLTLAGVRADTALGLKTQGQIDAERKLGLSTGAKIAIGVGAAALVGAFVLYQHYKELDETSD